MTTMSDLDHARRITMTEVIRGLLSRPTGPRSSVTITHNTSTGAYTVDVCVRAGDDPDVTTPDACAGKALELHNLVHDALDIGAVEPASVTLTRNAKGDTQIAVEVKTHDGETATLEQAVTVALEQYDRTRSAYPMANGLTAKPGTVS